VLEGEHGKSEFGASPLAGVWAASRACSGARTCNQSAGRGDVFASCQRLDVRCRAEDHRRAGQRHPERGSYTGHECTLAEGQRGRSDTIDRASPTTIAPRRRRWVFGAALICRPPLLRYLLWVASSPCPMGKGRLGEVIW